MAQTTTAPAATAVPPSTRPQRRRRRRRERPNWLAGVLATVWLVIVAVPLYYLVAASFRSRQDYLTSSPLKPPSDPTLDNYRTVFEGGFLTYLLNNVVVTVATVAIVVGVALPATATAALRLPARRGHRGRGGGGGLGHGQTPSCWLCIERKPVRRVTTSDRPAPSTSRSTAMALA